MKVVEFCCGYGGASAGILAAGLEIEASFDIWPVAVEQHRHWHPGVPCEVRDIATVAPDELAGRLVWASLPCQPYSTANIHKQTRGRNHPHYYSLAAFARQVQHARCALIENVPGLVWSAEGRAELLELEAECSRLGLGMSMHLVFSHWFGVNQSRRRAFILIGRDLPLVLIQAGQAGQAGQAVTCHSGGENTHSTKRNKVQASGAAILPTRTIAEVSALQGVPAPPAYLSKKDQYTLVGNCVPPLVAESIARQVFVPLLAAR